MNETDIDDRITERFDGAAVPPTPDVHLVVADVGRRVRRMRRRRIQTRVGALVAAAAVVAVVAATVTREDSPSDVATTPSADAAAEPVQLLTIGYREGPQLADPQTGNQSPLGPSMGSGWQWCNTCLLIRVGDRAYTVQNDRLFSYTAGDGQLRDIGTADAVLANGTGDGLLVRHGDKIGPAALDGSPTGPPSVLPDGYTLTEQPHAVGDWILISKKSGFIGELAAWNPATGAVQSLGSYNQLIDARVDGNGDPLVAWTTCPSGSFPCSLVIGNIDGTVRRESPPPVKGNGFYLGGAFSPDVTKLATTVTLHEGTNNPDAGLVIIDVASGETHLVADSRFVVGEPYGYVTWSPDGTTVYFNGTNFYDSVRAYTPSNDRLTELKFPGTYYSVAALPGLDRTHQCPRTEHGWQRGPASADESGDALPPEGTATEAAARAVAAEAPDQRIWAEPGRAWIRDPDGRVRIVPETLYTVVIELDSAASCPEAPNFSNGVGITYLVAGS